jgi:hypothetical protein
MFFIYFIGAIAVLLGLDYLLYKLFPGNEDHLVYRKEEFSVYANRHHLSFHFVTDYDDGEHMQLNMSTFWHSFFIPIRWWKSKRDENWNGYEYGIYFYKEGKGLFDTIWLGWGKHHRMFSMPWGYEHYRVTYEGKDGTRYTSIDKYERKYRKLVERRYKSHTMPTKPSWELCGVGSNFNWKAPYEYHLKSGEVQRTMALYHIEEREWRRKFLYWCPWFAMTIKYVEIELMDEIGERAGSWKGGTLAFGRPMLPGEDVHTAYQRIMKETKHE